MGKATNFRNAKEFSSALFRVFRVSALCKLFNIPKQNTKVLYKNKGILLSVEYLPLFLYSSFYGSKIGLHSLSLKLLRMEKAESIQIP